MASKQPAKSVFQSKVVIFNVLSFLVVVLGVSTPVVDSIVTDPHTASNVKDLLGAVIAVVNILLRFKTDQSLKLS